ncbi:dienelactone hydrolase family protein [Mucilaginibacter sp. RS28]|uniref:Dienelactone hydrolase family protein n=1 Tax=Mucilaginibacter straminoryzae TaxID=2932774 RepID=A0A9X1X5M7_9SPHI|nr:alpha/beta hydrolase [Mucilaginibacter straminoryzae]MCJ8210996.1 dienelactone hydrolase family protein [Mucilaginibacter straminoryzae]
MYTHSYQVVTAGANLSQAEGALVMIHGRGGSAQNIIGLADELNIPKLALYAPQATNHSWYPYSFMAPEEQNEPALSSALETIDKLVKQIIADGIPANKIFFLGFSQGACLTSEYIARNAQQYGGAVIFTGGVIGEELDLANYKGDFKQTPVLLTTGDPDPHVPVTRVEETADIFKKLNADFTLQVYKGRPHTITMQELKLAKQYVFEKASLNA